MPAWARAAACAALLLLETSVPSHAQNWPNRAVTMVVPFAAGGGTDVLGRIVARRLSETLGQQVIVENVGGAGGMVGSARVVKAPPDGEKSCVRVMRLYVRCSPPAWALTPRLPPRAGPPGR